VSQLFLNLEVALSDARVALEQAGEALHEVSVQAAQRKAEYDLKGDTVRRLEGALRALHGETGAAVVVSAPHVERRPRVQPPSGPVCDGCGEVGKLVRQGPLIVCTACQAQKVA